VTLQVIIFESSLSGMSSVESYVLKTWRAHASNNAKPIRPMTDDRQTSEFWLQSSPHKLMLLSARVPISPLLLSLCPKGPQQHLSL
jgi:hypothetical protein